jgi:hypothetical protein
VLSQQERLLSGSTYIDIAHTDSASHDCGIEGVVGDGGVGLVVGLSKREGCRGRLSRIDFP